MFPWIRIDNWMTIPPKEETALRWWRCIFWKHGGHGEYFIRNMNFRVSNFQDLYIVSEIGLVGLEKGTVKSSNLASWQAHGRDWNGLQELVLWSLKSINVESANLSQWWLGLASSWPKNFRSSQACWIIPQQPSKLSGLAQKFVTPIDSATIRGFNQYRQNHQFSVDSSLPRDHWFPYWFVNRKVKPPAWSQTSEPAEIKHASSGEWTGISTQRFHLKDPDSSWRALWFFLAALGNFYAAATVRFNDSGFTSGLCSWVPKIKRSKTKPGDRLGDISYQSDGIFLGMGRNLKTMISCFHLC